MDVRPYVVLRKPAPDLTNYNAGAEFAARSLSTRPLSDIREITEPSLFEASVRKSGVDNTQQQRISRQESLKKKALAAPTRPPPKPSTWSPFPSPKFNDDKSSVYSIPLGSIPPRASSKTRDAKRSTSVSRAPAILFPPPKQHFRAITNNGQSESPIKEAVKRLDPEYEHRGRPPSKTILKVENNMSLNILNKPVHLHPRVKLDLLVVAPLFVGGSSVEGTVQVIVDEADRMRHRKTLTLERLSIDLLGIEEVSGGRRHVFLALGNELVDMTHPPPNHMVESQQPAYMRDKSWILIPSVSSLPFLIRLPLEVGPPPFKSKHAAIRYILCATLWIKDGGRQLSVRSTQETAILSVYDPEKALKSLPSPLTVTETCHASRTHGQDYVTVTAGLHRQVWVSGTNIFADVHIINNSRKTIKKLELQLERRVLCYKHAAAATLEMSASQARIFDQDERTIASKTVVKPESYGWSGVMPHSSLLRTCDLELPRHHATIKCNKYFEVRYFLNVIISTSHIKPVMVQLPIILIHMNSLDVPTNSVAQVAAAIEEKRHARSASKSRHGNTSTNHTINMQVTPPSPHLAHATSHPLLQGRAFNAPRMQSLERARRQAEDVAELGRILDNSPRRSSKQYAHIHDSGQKSVHKMPSSFSFKTPPSNRKGRIIEPDTADEIRRQLGHFRGASAASNATTGRSVHGVCVGHARAVSLPGHNRAVSNASRADTNKSLPRRPSESIPRADALLALDSRSGNRDGLTVLEPIPMSNSGSGEEVGEVENDDAGKYGRFGMSDAFSLMPLPTIERHSLESRRPRWAHRPAWMRRDRSVGGIG